MRKIQILAVVLSVYISGVCLGDIFTVDDDGPADFSSIQDAIDWSWHGDTIKVWPGTYIEPRLNLYGKQITVTSINPNDPNIVENTIIDGDSVDYVVYFSSLEDNDTILTGFTIQNGNDGIYCYYSSPNISNCIVKDINNYGISGYSSDSQPNIYKCTVYDGLWNVHGEIDFCTIIGSDIRECDGHINGCTIIDGTITYCDGLISNCKILGGGESGISGISYCSADIIACVIAGKYYGIYRCLNNNVINCTIVGNRLDGYYSWPNGSVNLKNNIIVNNLGYGIYRLNTVNLNLEYNNVWGNSYSYYDLPPGPTDIHTNPRFAIDGYWDDNGTPGDTNDDFWVQGEYHLKSEAGRWDPNQTWIIDNFTSHCIDAGKPDDDVGDEPQPNGSRINMGAYGGTVQASKSFGASPGMVENLSIQGGYKQISLSWDEPIDTGGLPITAYKIYRGPSAGELTYYDEVGEGELSFIDTDVQNDTVYFYTVSAVSGFGEGSQITPVSITATWLRSDLNGDGIVNLLDWFMFASEWLNKSPWHTP